jgi:hypothetical protein
MTRGLQGAVPLPPPGQKWMMLRGALSNACCGTLFRLYFQTFKKGAQTLKERQGVPFVKKMKHFYCTKQSKTAQASKAQRSQRLKPQSLSTKCDQKHKAENSSNNKTIAPLASPLSGWVRSSADTLPVSVLQTDPRDNNQFPAVNSMEMPKLKRSNTRPPPFLHVVGTQPMPRGSARRRCRVCRREIGGAAQINIAGNRGRHLRFVV